MTQDRVHCPIISIPSLRFISYVYVRVDVCECVCAHACSNVWGSEEGIKFTIAGVTGGYELSSMGVSSQTGPQREQQVLLTS